MRIERGEKLAGIRIEAVRALLRRFPPGFQFNSLAVGQQLEISPAHATRLARALLRAGYIREIDEHDSRRTWYECTLAGTALAGATMAPPLRRSTVHRLIEDVIQRARTLNANDGYAFRVDRLALFGSALGDKARPNDVDIAVSPVKRYQDPVEQQRAERARTRVAVEAGRRFRDLDDLFWPHTEVMRALRGRSRGLSLCDGEAPRRLGVDARVIFEDAPQQRRRRATR